MSAEPPASEPFVDYSHTCVTATDPSRVVVEQPAVRDLDNHVGVRHASALHLAGYEASRALVVAALGDLASSVDLRLAESEIAYTAVGLGLLTTTAEPTGAGWDGLATALGAGASVTLACGVTTADEEGKAVAELELSWIVEPAGSAY